MVSLDIYQNETTRHAHVVLPGLSHLEHSHYDIALRQLAIRNVATLLAGRVCAARGSAVRVAEPAPARRDRERAGAACDLDAIDDMVLAQRVDTSWARRDRRSRGAIRARSWRRSARVAVPIATST